MSYKAYNDYELIYLANDRNDTVALEILLKKYEKYIYKKIVSFFPFSKDVDDYFQEGLMCLYKAIKTFKQAYNKTFMRYFEVVLKRHFINLYHKQKREYDGFLLIINEAKTAEQVVNPDFDEKHNLRITFKSNVENLIYEEFFINGKSVSYIAEKSKLTKKQIYNSIYRIKQKLKNEYIKYKK